MTIKLSVDRIDGAVAVCYDDEKKYEIPATGLKEGDIILAEFDEEMKLISRNILQGETEKKKSEMALRTKNLFNRSKK